MKNQLAALGVALVVSNVTVFANNHAGSGAAVAPAAPVSHSSTPTTVAPHLNGTPHLSGPTAYRPVINSANGTRTLQYPAVRNSMLHQPTHSSAAKNLNNAFAVQHRGNLQQGAIKNHPLDPQTSARLKNWNGTISTAQQAHLNNVNNLQHHHDHDWWHHHCVTFVFFDLGWWGWWDGWWYPAWGYDPYSYYDYREPIYGSNGESPEQIVAGVQGALQQNGYYQYAIDGKMGPLTRSALARYQRDHRLPITSGIDPATLGSLGIIR